MTDILHIPELAHALNTTEAAIRQHIQRRTDAVPPWFRRGIKYCWNKETVDKWRMDREIETSNERVVRPAPRRSGGNKP